jgi:peptidoglycan/xylan/chitin deacetylase (PgdA/CDA1 family)
MLKARVTAGIAILLLGAAVTLPAGAVALQSQVALLDVGAPGGGASRNLEIVTLRRIFTTLGIPVDEISSVDRLSDYRIVCTAGALTNTALSTVTANAFYDFVESGGVLVSAGETGNALFSLFGLAKQMPSRQRYRLSFTGTGPALSLIAPPYLRTISLGNGEKHFFDDVIWSHGAALAGDAAALGVFDDGTVGLSVHPYGRGRAYLLGVSYTDSVLLPQTGGSYNAERQYANGVEPSADVIMLILKSVCASVVSPFVCLSTIPYAAPVGLVLSHDVDAQSSFLDSLKFASLEATFGVKSTFFITTKYFTDASDIGYFDVPENAGAVRELGRRGWEIGSHTVSHSVDLAQAPEGDPAVTRKTYDPVSHLSVWGEAKVSKELLDHGITGQHTISYRSGDLAFPRSLIRVLEGCGYRYDSTYSANAVLTAFPYFAFEDQDLSSHESSIVEIPVTLDDSQGALTPDNVSDVVKEWLDVVDSTGGYGGLTVLLMHPSDTRTRTYKLQAQEAVMRAVAAQKGWMGDLATAGAFWRNRAVLRFTTLKRDDGALVIRLSAPDRDIDPAIGFEVAGAVKTVEVQDSEGKKLDYSILTRGGKLFAARRR